MQARSPIVAGQFYPGQRDSCVDEINECLKGKPLGESLPETIVAGIVPHAGWTFSGSLAALVFSAIKQRHEKVNTFVIFGAAHGYFGQSPAVYETGGWITPLGEVSVSEELAGAVLSSVAVISDSAAHRAEHSIEVQIPFIQHLFPRAEILPIIVPPSEQAVALGTSVGEIISRDEHKKIVCIGSTDLTHYGPRYGFTPMGTGAEALKWADRVNDQKFIDLALQLEPQNLLTSAAENCNACGAGAAAAAVAAAKKLGKTRGLLLAHTNSNEVMLQKMGATSADSVGYAAIIF
ncbi:MAG: AmmeMemoRadiSam system protein B [Planctomycetota bacterium]|jgi:AmmeMemoRadiSam system protein B